jgi:hypothetical protein
MSQPENFLTRWSRRKQEAAHAVEQAGDTPDVAHASKVEADASTGGPIEAAAGEEKKPEFDLSTLPPIDSIDVGTDIRSFLQKGVPLELTRAALRRAWSADPTIRDFIGIAENQWDFATGSDIPGFGPLEASDDVRRLVAEVFRGRRTAPVGTSVAPIFDPPTKNTVQNTTAPDNSEPTAQQFALPDFEPQKMPEQASSDERETILHCEEDSATQQDAPLLNNPLPIKRTHGGALPQ